MHTTDHTNPKLGYGIDEEPVDQNEVYLVLSEEERAKGFIRPYRDSYIHQGRRFTTYTLLDEPEGDIRGGDEYVAIFDITDASGNHIGGHYATQKELDRFLKTGFVGGCGGLTRMSQPISETYARDPKFYGSTYCVHCRMHLAVSEFIWDADGQTVGS